MSAAARIGVLLAVLVSVLVLGWVDFATGPDYGLDLFYLAAVVTCGVLLGGPTALVMACFTATVWVTADLLPREPIHGKALAWNALTRLAILATGGELTARMRRDRDQLASIKGDPRRLQADETEPARTDPLTDLKSRHGFHEVLELARSARNHTPGRPT
jgi:hypothetical protein